MICSKCGEDKIPPAWVIKAIAENPKKKFVCGYCNAESAANYFRDLKF
jgi:hypothetical protein